MICRAERCKNVAMEGGQFCGYHDEENEKAPVKCKNQSSLKVEEKKNVLLEICKLIG